MAYRRPAIEVIQEFQAAAAALALPSLPAVIVGPGYQIADDVNVGTYSEEDLSITSYSYSGLTPGALVDLTAEPTDDAELNAHKAVSLTLQDLYLVKEPALPSTSRISGALQTPNVFQDLLTGAFSSFDPDAEGAPTFYIDVIGGAGIAAADIGRKLVIGKTDDNNLVVAAEWQSTLPLLGVEYRVLEFREEEEYPNSSFSGNGISADSDSVDVLPGLASRDATPLPVVEATVLLSWRALRPDLANALNVFTNTDSLEAVFGVGSIVPANVGAFAVNLALQNTTTEVSFTGLGADFFTNAEVSWQSALDYLESKDVYALAVLTKNTAVHQSAKTHVEGMSLSTVGRERVAFVNRTLVEEETLVPPSGIGTETSAGTDNGTSPAGDNKTFKDPTNGAFITDGVNTGHYLQIVDYTAIEGVHRSVTPNERDWFDDSPAEIQITNGSFVGGDVGRKILVRDATTVGNDQVYNIDTVVNARKVTTTPAPTAAEVMPGTTRAWITDLSRTIAHDAADAVVAATKTWSFTNGAFTEADVGRLMFITNAADADNNGVFTIGGFVNATTVTTLEAPGADEVFGVTVTQTIHVINREPARDIAADSVNGTSREWTVLGAVFTSEDVGRKLRVAGAQNAGNNADHIIEAVLSTTVVRTSNVTTPVTEEFTGLDPQTTLTTLDVVSVTPSSSEAAFITGTRHLISAIVSESQLTLASDPTAGFGGTLEDVEYTIVKELTLSEQAAFLAGYATSFASRRLVHTWPDVLAVSVNGVLTAVPGFFAGAVLAGLTAGLPSQAGLTNLSVAGFLGRENSDDKFSDTQLDTIAGGGNFIFVQPVADAALSVRHQLTTDVSAILFQEFSVTKNVDLIARFFRNLYRPFLGIYNITDTLLDLLKTRGEAGITFLKEQRAPRVGAPLREGQLTRIEESTISPDTVEIDIDVNVPLPLNNIKLTLLV
jgi:hypothetical protein